MGDLKPLIPPATAADVAVIDTNIDTLLARLTAARALLLDELTAIRMEELDAANIPADIDSLKQRSVTNVSMIEFWSDIDDIITLTTATADVDLPNVIVADIPANTTIIRTVGMIRIRAMNNTSVSTNAINGAGLIKVKKSTAAWATDDVNLINITDNIWSTSASTKEGGMLIEGDNDAASEVDENATYNLRFNGNIFVDGNNLELIDVAVGLKVYFISS